MQHIPSRSSMDDIISKKLGFADVQSESRATLYGLYATWFLLCAAFAVLMAALPLVLVDVVGPDEAPMYQGLLASTTAASGLVLCSSLGHLSDRFGRLLILRVWSVTFALGIVLVVLGHYSRSVGFLFVARLPAMSVPFFISSALCSDVVEGPVLLQSHGHIGAIMGLAAVVGSVISGVVGHVWGLTGAVVSGLALGLAGLLLALCSPPPAAQKSLESAHGYIDAIRIVFREKLLRYTVLSFALTRVGNVNVVVIYVLYASYRFQWTIFEVSLMLGIRGALAVYCQAAATRYLAALPPRSSITAQHWLLAIHPGTMLLMGIAWDGPTFAMASLVNTVTFVSISLFTTKVASLAQADGIAGLALGTVGTIQNGIEMFAAVAFGYAMRWTVTTVPSDSIWSGLPLFVNAIWYLGVWALYYYADTRYGHLDRLPDATWN